MFILDINITNPEVFCKIFEENQICIVVAELKHLSPRTNHITITYKYLQSFVQNKIIWIYYIYVIEQTVDIFTKRIYKSL